MIVVVFRLHCYFNQMIFLILDGIPYSFINYCTLYCAVLYYYFLHNIEGKLPWHGTELWCSFYLDVVILRPLWEKNSLTGNSNSVPYISLLLFSAQYGKKFPDIELKLFSLYLAIVIFRLIWGKISQTWNWNYDPFISLLLFSAQYGKKIPWHETETMFPLSRCCYFPHNVEENLYFVWRGGGRTDTIHHGPQLCPSPPPSPLPLPPVLVDYLMISVAESLVAALCTKWSCKLYLKGKV